MNERFECALQVVVILGLVASTTCNQQSGYDISKIGDVFEKKLSVPFGNVAFLIAAPAVERPGVIFGYRAYIADASAMLVLHLWRPVPSTGRHRLMDVVYFSPNRTGEVDIYVRDRGRQCARALAGDLIGLYNINSTGAVAYRLNAGNPHARVRGLSTDPIEVGEEVAFDSLSFPHIFAVAAYIVAETGSDGMVNCPDVQIPVETSTTMRTTTMLPPTGRPGDTGATGQKGEPGDTGDTGNTGFTGATGNTGRTGHIGVVGVIGSMGDTGATGFTGHTGRTGPVGVIGLAGATGDAGPQGETGPRGETGKSAAPPPRTGEQSEGKWWREEWCIKGLYIWLAVVSFLALVALVWSIVLCARWCSLKSKTRRRDVARHSFINAYPVK